MSPTAYSFVSFDMSRATLHRAPVFIVTHNGSPLPGESFATQEEAARRAGEISRDTGSALGCFSVERVVHSPGPAGSVYDASR